jgi:diguanylate cyclase (GGDEF)-like protein
VHHRTDELTQLPLRSAFIEATHASLEAARARAVPLALLVVDVDHFKLINDRYGHLQGDDVLQRVAEILRQNLRGYDVAARYAGDEFVALLPDTSLERAREVAERICAATRQHAFALRDRGAGPAGVLPALVPRASPAAGGAALSVTLSVGVAAYPDHGVTTEALFDAADRALYHVKRNGRDGVATAAAAEQASAHLPLGIERFVGRTEELRALVRLLEDAASGRPRVVAISGEAGVGKSTLLRHLEPEVRLRGGTLVAGRCHEADVQPPYGPWAELLDALRRRGAASADPSLFQWRELPQLVPALGPAAIGRAAAALSAHAVIPADPRGGKYMLLDEIADFLRAAARERPLVVVIEDVQWADAASWDGLEHLLLQLDGDRVLVCLTMRTEEMQGEALERRRRLSRLEPFREITLERLTHDELREWVEGAFHHQEVGPEFLAFLFGQTEGNPLFIVQLLRTLVDEGAVWHSGERWEWKPVSELRLPIGVGDLISRRLARLSPRAQGVLTTAAVIGREFDVDLAIEAGAGSEDDLLDAIDEGVRAAVLQPAPERGGDRYVFAHVLLAEVLRDSMNPRRLRRVHANVARALERWSPGAAAEIATHYDRGGDAAGAYRHAIVAADRARQVYAHQEGAEFLRVAERNASNPGELAEVRVRRAAIAEASGSYDEALEQGSLAIEWFAARGDGARALPLRLARERVRALLGQPARATLDACLALDAEARALAAERGGDGAAAAMVTTLERERVLLLRTISQMLDRLGDREAAERVAWGCVRVAERVVARANEPAVLAGALQRLAVTLERERPAQALEVLHRALDLYRGAGDCAGQANCHNSLGILHTARGNWAQAELDLSTAISLGRTAGTPDVWGLYTLNLGVVFLKAGDHDRARDLFGEALALFATVRHGERQLYALYNLAHLEHERGDAEAAAELFDVALAMARQIGQSDVEIGALAGAGLARLDLGELAAAQKACRDADERLRERADWFQGRELVEALRVCVSARRGAADEAVRHFQRALPLARAADFYSAAWLTARVADVLLGGAAAGDGGLAPESVAGAVLEYAVATRRLGYRALAHRFEALLSGSGTAAVGAPRGRTSGQIVRSA